MTVNGRGDTPNRHDILTGSMPDGTKTADQTCGDWTLDGTEGVAMVGHHDRMGLNDTAAGKILELVASFARRLQPGSADRHRRRRAVLLLRGELILTPHRSAQSLATGRSAFTATDSSGLVLRVWNTTQ